MLHSLKSYRLFLLGLLALPLNSFAIPLNPTNTAIAATVNGVNISVGELDQLILSDPGLSQVVDANQDESAINSLRKKILKSFIDRLLILQAAKKSDLVKKNGSSELYQQLVQRSGGEDNLKSMLKTRKIDLEAFKKNLEDDYLISEYINKDLAKDIKVSEKELKAVFDTSPEKFATPEQVHARHILLTLPKDADAEKEKSVKKEIEAIYEQVNKDPDSFAEVAKEKSQCPSAPKGGDLGYFTAKQMVPQFSEAAFKTKVGSISKPVRTQFGYHIIKIEDHKQSLKPEFDSAKPKIEAELLARKKAQAAQTVVEKLRGQAQIAVLIDEIEKKK